jgi:ABC-type multidrug transport system fused ATPase/permease subunit
MSSNPNKQSQKQLYKQLLKSQSKEQYNDNDKVKNNNNNNNNDKIKITPEDIKNERVYSPIVFEKLLWSYIRENKWYFIIFIVVTVLIWCLNIYGINYVAGLLTTQSHNINKSNDGIDKMWYYLTIFMGIWIFSGIVRYIQSAVFRDFLPDYVAYVRNIIFKYTVEAYKENFRNIKFGTFMSEITDITHNLKWLFVYLATEVLIIGIGIIIQLIYLYMLDIRLCIISLVSLVTALCVISYYIPHLMKITIARERQYLKINNKLHDSFDNLLNIYVNNETKTEIEEAKINEADYAELGKMQIDYINNYSGVAFACTLIYFASTAGFSIKLLQDGSINVAQFATLFYILRSYTDLFHAFIDDAPKDIFLKIGVISNYYPILEKIFEVDKYKRYKNVITHGKIEYKNVSFKYTSSDDDNNDDGANTDYILHGVDLNINAGEKVLIYGRSGLGKSTLTKLLVKLYTSYEGEILIDGVEIGNIDTEYLRDKVIYVNQSTNLRNETILDNIKFGDDHIDDQHIVKILKKYNLLELYDNLEDGVNTKANVQGSNLSLGMQRVVIIMRGLMKLQEDNSKIIIFDEPLTSLDEKTRSSIIKLINNETKGKTSIIISHTGEFNKIVDRVIDFTKLNNNDEKKNNNSSNNNGNNNHN